MSTLKSHSRQKSLKLGKLLAKEESQKAVSGLIGSQSPPPMIKQKREYTAANSEMETRSKQTSPMRTWNLSTDLSKTSFNDTRQRSPFYDRTAEEVTYLKLAVKARLNKSKERGDYRSNFFNESPPPVPEFNVYRKASPPRSSPLKKNEAVGQRSRNNFPLNEESLKHSATVVSPDVKNRQQAKLSSKEDLEISPIKANKHTPFHFMNQDTNEQDMSPFNLTLKKGHMRHSSTGHSRHNSNPRIRHVQSLEVSFSGENKRYKTTYENDDKESSYTRDLSPFRENRPAYEENVLTPLTKAEKTEAPKETPPGPMVLQKNFRVNRGGGGSDGNLVFQRGVAVDHEVFSPIKFCGDFGDIDESVSFIRSNNNSSPGIKKNELKYKIGKILETKKSQKIEGKATPVTPVNISELKKKKISLPKRGGSSNNLNNSQSQGQGLKPFSVMQHLIKTLTKSPKLVTEEKSKYNREGVFSPSRLEKINTSLAAKKSASSGKDQRSQSKLKGDTSSKILNSRKPARNPLTTTTKKEEKTALSTILKVKNLVEPDFNDMMTLSVDYREGHQEEASKIADDHSPGLNLSQIPKILDDKSVPGESKSNPREELEEVLKNSSDQPPAERRKKRDLSTKIKPSRFKTQVSGSRVPSSSELESTDLQTTTAPPEEAEKVKRAIKNARNDSINFSEDSPSSDRADLKEVWINIPLDKPLLINKAGNEGPYDISVLFEENITRFETFKKFGNVAASIKLLNEINQELETFESKFLETSSNKPEVEANLLSFKIQARNKLAFELYLSQNYQASLEQSQKVLEIDRCNIQAIYKSFQAYTKLGDKKKAKELLKRIQKLMQIPALVQHNQKFMLGDMSFNSNSNSQSSRRSQSLEDSQDLNTSAISASEIFLK